MRALMVHEGTLPLEDLEVGDTFVLSDDHGYALKETLPSSAEAIQRVLELAPDTVLEVGKPVRACEIHPKTATNGAVCRAVWTNGLAFIEEVDLQKREVTLIVRRGRLYARMTKRFPPYRAKPEACVLRAG
jgi:hypothetical protein